MSGVSSMMTSTPVASSNARMFRPSRPMMRPFISSFGQRHRGHRDLGACARRRYAGWPARRSSSPRARRSRSARLADLAQPVGGVGVRLLLQAANELGLGVLRGHAGQLLEPAPLVARPASRAPARGRPTVFSRRPKSLARRLISLSRCSRSSNLRSSVAFALDDAALVALDFLAAAADLDLPRLAQLDQLFLAGDDRALAQRFRLALARRRGCASLSLRQSPSPAPAAACPAARRPDVRPKKKKAAQAMNSSTPSAA